MASTPSRIGTFTIGVDGEWDMDDLRAVSQGLSEAYGLFYPLVAQDEVVRQRLQDSIRATFWSGDADSRFIAERLYRQVPKDEGIKLKSFHYSSAGAMTIVGVLTVLYLMARVANAWIKTGEGFLDLWRKVEKFFEDRKHLRKARTHFELDDDMALSADEARNLVFDIGVPLGFSRASCEALITIVGNPISALKYLAAAGKEGRKMANLAKEGKLQLPVPNSDEIELRSSISQSFRRGRRGTPPYSQ